MSMSLKPGPVPVSSVTELISHVEALSWTHIWTPSSHVDTCLSTCHWSYIYISPCITSSSLLDRYIALVVMREYLIVQVHVSLSWWCLLCLCLGITCIAIGASESQELGVQYGGRYGRCGLYCLLLTR